VPQFAASKDGTRIAYQIVGHGPVVILILGALNSRKSGASLAKLLASRFTVVSYDRRGRGDSTDTPPYSPTREVEDVEALAGAVGGPVCLYGHSSGGAIALQSTIKLRGQVRRIAVYEVPYSVDIKARKAAEEYYRELEKLLASGRNGDAVALFIKFVGVSDKQLKAIKRMPMWRGLERMASTLAYDSEVLGQGHSLPAPLLSRIAVPTLVMHGGAGAPSMRNAAQAIRGAIPKAQLRTLAGQTHGVRPKAIGPLLEEFFS
jgi:pimeloyl-ACP methyl ester carboxylesterase